MRAKFDDEVHSRVIRALKAQMRLRHWSVNNLADFSGISRGYLSDMLTAKKSPTLRTLVRLAAGLEIDVSVLLAPTVRPVK